MENETKPFKSISAQVLEMSFVRHLFSDGQVRRVDNDEGAID